MDLFLRKPFSRTASGFCCFTFTSTELLFVFARRQAEHNIIELCESYRYSDKTQLFSQLDTVVKSHDLKNSSCSLILQPDDFQLIVTDALPVKDEEFQAAIRWKIKELIKIPVEDVVVDSFALPKMQVAKNKIMVVAARASELQEVGERVQECGLNLESISIPELALLNICNLYEESEKTIVFIYIQETYIQLLMTANHEIYVSRQLKFTLNTESTFSLDQSMDRLTSEIQRSFDYYHSLWPTSSPARFILASTKSLSNEAIEQLAEKIRSPIELIDVMKKIECKVKLDINQQGKFLPVIGGVLRENEK